MNLLRTLTVVIGTLAAHGAVTAQLQQRDLNSDGTIDAFYDVAQNVTWLADANYGGTTGTLRSEPLLAPGNSRLRDALSWAAQLDVYGVTGWRLPQSFVPDLAAQCSAGNGMACIGRVTFDSELSRLYDQVGTASPFINTSAGGGYAHWTGNTFQGGGPGQTFVQVFSFGSGQRIVTDETNIPFGLAWAVHDGDVGTVAAIPEPSTYVLMLAGLAAVGFVVRRRAQSS
jgi:PEP-CTERM motif